MRLSSKLGKARLSGDLERIEIAKRKDGKMDIQRLRNLTTGRLHTEMGHIYEDLELITGEKGLMTHMLPRVLEAVIPWIRKHVTDKRFWDGKYDKTHIGNVNLPNSTNDDRKEMFGLFAKMTNPLVGKDVVVVTT